MTDATYADLGMRVSTSTARGSGSAGMTSGFTVARFPSLAGWAGIAGGSVVMLGWILDVDALKSFLPGLLTMKVNAALCFIALGTALVLARGHRAVGVAVALSAFVVALAVLTLVQYAFGLNLGIDELLFEERRDAVGTVIPGRMSPISAVCFILLAVALMLGHLLRRPHVAAGMSIVALVLAVINVLDFVYAAEAPTFLAGYTQMAVNTAAMFVVLALGILAMRPDRGPLGVLVGKGTAASLSRRLVVAAIAIPITVGWLRLQGQTAGLYGTAYGLTLTTVATIGLLITVVWYSARQVRSAIQARDEAELQLRELAKELSRSNEELQQFASVASHDLQEPLRKIMAFGERLESQFGEALGPSGSDYVARMRTASRRMQRLINDLLEYSRVSSRPREVVPVDLRRVVNGVLGDLESSIEESGADVRIGRLPTVEADPLQMRQLFQNLVGNAIKYRDPDRAPVVEVRAARERDDGDGRAWWRVTVSDNGIGFEEQYLDRIFAPFQRLHSRAEFEGSGIGLAICRKIVDRLGGEITARSQPGAGSTFVVTLPGRAAAGSAVPAVAAVAA